ncbi:AAA family ATPase [Patescibacteria group bacterium]|nr:AAA family ATPase [Patescibacteria group bacterium]
MIIGITGTDGAGKGTVVDYLVTHHGFGHYSSRDFIMEEINRLNLPTDRNQLRLTANDLREQFGNDVIVRKAFEKATTEQKDAVVIESIRAMAEVEYLKLHGGILLAVDADPVVRYARVQGRRSETDKVTYDEFLAHEALENNDPNPHGMQKAKVMAAADYIIKNSADKKTLAREVEKFIQSLAQ